jgi:hypothetical protein
MYIMLNSGVTSDPLPDARTIFPNSFLVDYVRVYSRPPVTPLHDGGFEEESLDPWWKTKGDVRLVTVHSHSGTKSLQLASPAASFQQRIFGLKLNTAYRVTAWADPGGGSVRLGVTDFAAPEQFISTSGSGYRQVIIDFTTTRYIGSATLIGSKTSGDGPAVFDDLLISEK